MMEVVDVVRPSMVSRGCCCYLSPAKTTTGRLFTRLNVPAIVSKMTDEIMEASSMMTRSYLFME